MQTWKEYEAKRKPAKAQHPKLDLSEWAVGQLVTITILSGKTPMRFDGEIVSIGTTRLHVKYERHGCWHFVKAYPDKLEKR